MYAEGSPRDTRTVTTGLSRLSGCRLCAEPPRYRPLTLTIPRRPDAIDRYDPAGFGIAGDDPHPRITAAVAV